LEIAREVHCLFKLLAFHAEKMPENSNKKAYHYLITKLKSPKSQVPCLKVQVQFDVQHLSEAFFELNVQIQVQ